MGKFDKEIAEAIEKLRPICKVPILTNGLTPGSLQELNFIEEKGDIPPYLSFEYETGFVVMTQKAFNKLTAAAKNKLMAPLKKGRTKK